MKWTGGRWLAPFLILALLAIPSWSAARKVEAEPPSPPAGFRALSGSAAAAFVVPGDVRLVHSFGLPAYGVTYERYQQYLGAAEVLGAQITLYRDGSGGVRTVIGAHYPGIAPKNAVRLSPADAAAIAERDVGPGEARPIDLLIDPASARFFFRVETHLAGPPADSGELGARLGPIIASRWVHWIDAENGQVLNKYDAIANDGYGTGVKGDTKDLDGLDNSDGNGADDLTTYHSASGHGATGAHWDLFSTDNRQKTYDARNGTVWLYYTTDADNHWTNVTSDRKSPGQPALVDAQHYANVTDDYYQGRHGFDWVADGGYAAGMQSVAHYSRNYNNAFWNGTYTIYGDGDGSIFREFSGGLDLVAHEYTHGVTDATSGLIYQGESGALNESFSDMMGNSAEFFANEPSASNCVRMSAVNQGQDGCADWWIGEDVYLSADGVPGFRNMADPQEDGNPDHYSERYTGTSDNGGVHSNSGIPNNAYFLLVIGGKNAGCSDSTWRSPSATHTHAADCGVTVAGIGLDKAEKIFFLAFTGLSANGTMSNARDATWTAANSLYADATTNNAVACAWQAVGVSGTNACAGTPTSTPTSTSTATSTPTATRTPTNTPTATATPTTTPTYTPAAAGTATPTSTPTATATATPSSTATEAPTDTPTSTPTDTPTPTSTPADTPTPTSTPAGSANDMYVWDIAFESRTRGKGGAIHDERILVTVRRDSDADGVAEGTDAPVANAAVSVELTRPDGSVGTFSGTTNSAGVYATPWIRGVPDGTYTAEVTGLVSATFNWNQALDPNGDDTDTDGDDLPEQSHSVPH